MCSNPFSQIISWKKGWLLFCRWVCLRCWWSPVNGCGVGFPTLARTPLKNSNKRPLVYKNNQNNIEKIFIERKKIYSLAAHEINCDNLNINQISNKIIKLYEAI